MFKSTSLGTVTCAAPTLDLRAAEVENERSYRDKDPDDVGNSETLRVIEKAVGTSRTVLPPKTASKLPLQNGRAQHLFVRLFIIATGWPSSQSLQNWSFEGALLR